MKWVWITFVLMLPLAPPSWADDDKSQSPSEQKDGVRVEDLPKPIPELLEQLQSLSQKIEPEITKLGSKLGQELNQTVKKLREELEARRRQEPERSTENQPSGSQ